jgi:hypothetical protein
MRRAIRYGRNIGLTKPFLHETVHKVFEIMDDAYPELKDSASFIINVVKNEEAKFSETLDVGLKLLKETLAGMEERGEKEIPGDIIFKLYDTFGFPVDIINDVVKGSGITLDMAGYTRAMDAQKNRSKKKKTFTGVGDAFKSLTAGGVKTVFTGYDSLETETEILLIVKNDKEIQSAEKGDVIDGYELIELMNKVIDEYNIDTVYTHWDKDVHQDHSAIGKATFNAGRHINNILMYRSNWYHTSSEFRGNYYSDISDFIDIKIKSVKAHKNEYNKFGDSWIEFFVNENT